VREASQAGSRGGIGELPPEPRSLVIVWNVILAQNGGDFLLMTVDRLTTLLALRQLQTAREEHVTQRALRFTQRMRDQIRTCKEEAEALVLESESVGVPGRWSRRRLVEQRIQYLTFPIRWWNVGSCWAGRQPLDDL